VEQSRDVRQRQAVSRRGASNAGPAMAGAFYPGKVL